ncbi:hypothetical protein SAY86_002709 [Trapa natans]|uniref:Ubiquitin-like protease family profile domain-containing protein n=1 Tax=Trapa natans TaxID=22666 RepID=A0AAN7R2Q6_TRANT|nr:hypothetical protein SAY86_002709 [Trapa natans]
MGKVERGGKKLISLDWDALLAESDDLVPELIVTAREDQSPVECSGNGDTSDQGVFSEIESLSDQKLEESIASKFRTLQKLGSKLPDGGTKLRGMLSSLLDERKRRKLHPNVQYDDECPRIMLSRSPNLKGPCDGLRDETTLSQKQASFGQLFSESLDENNSRRIAVVNKASFSLNHGEWHRKKSKRKLSPAGRRKLSPSPRHASLDRKNHHGNVNQQGRACTPTPISSGLVSPHCDMGKDGFNHPSFSGSKSKGQTVVLDDEEECHFTGPAEEASESPECMNDTKIYYPSRDDPGSVEICFTDLDCLKPEGYLTSPIMNFYIIYLQLQASLSSRGISDYLFFNTYFYKKLQEAVLCKGIVKDASFTKFRRWWKGVNIFQKAYVFIPIHEDLHWSLAIICAPDEDGSGPILLHLDSLQLHRSKSIFDNIRRFLSEEWNHLKEEVAASNRVIADEVWEVLPHLISERKIMVVFIFNIQ